MYKKVSIPKNGDGAGCSVPKSSDIIIMDVEDVETEPTRTVGNPVLVGDFKLKKDAKAIAIYGTPSSINLSEEYAGEADARGVKQGVAFEHPGNSAAIKGHIEAFMNKGVIILVKECNGTAAGRVQAFGSKCNPLFLSLERTDNKESNKRKFTWKQELVDKFLPGDYTGAMPAVEATVSGTGETA